MSVHATVYSVYPAAIPSVLPRRAGAKGKDSKPAGAVYALEGSVAYSGSVIQWLRDNLQVNCSCWVHAYALCYAAPHRLFSVDSYVYRSYVIATRYRPWCCIVDSHYTRGISLVADRCA
jgi:hypothetical protein